MKYSIIRKPNRKTASVMVDIDNSVSVIVPEHLSDDEIKKVIQKKRQWILKKQALNNEVRRPAEPKEFISGETITYLGRNYRLKVNKGSYKPLEYVNGVFAISCPEEGTQVNKTALTRDLLIDWYKEHALIKFKQRVKRYTDLLDVSPFKVKVGDFKRQWGSCHQDGTIVFNWQAIMAPMSIVDYIVVHELCHLIHDDHSSEFWRLVAKLLPDYKERKEWLRVNGPYLNVY